jgi:hypothetical protein
LVMQTERRALDYGSRFIEMELREQAMKIVQGWPKMRVNFKALIWIFSQSVGPVSQFGPTLYNFR